MNSPTRHRSLMAEIGRKARAASRPLAIASTESKNAALTAMADAIERNEKAILDANAIDIANGEEAGLSPAMMDRLKLTPARIKAMANGVREIAALADPVGEVIAAMGPAERPAHRARAHAARRHRRDL